MGQGAIKYRGKLMLNCRESYLSNIGELLGDVASRPQFSKLVPLAESWEEELEMPPGCSSISLDEYLQTEEIRQMFVLALQVILAELGSDKPGTRHLVEQIRILLSHGYEQLEPVHRGSAA